MVESSNSPDGKHGPERWGERRLHIIAVLTAVAAFPLIWMGGLVTSHKAGLAVPDWPNSYGYNMFLYPISEWIGGIFYEHTHRLLGMLVGFLAVLLALNAWGPGRKPALGRWLVRLGIVAIMGGALLGGVTLGMAGPEELPRAEAASRLSHWAIGMGSLGLVLFAAGLARHREKRAWMRWVCVAALSAIILQGLLGGLRVVMVQLGLAVVHGILAQAVFAGLVVIAFLTRPRRHDVTSANPPSRAARRWARAAVVVVFVQLVLGATMRHFDAGLAIPDLPWAFGHLAPPVTAEGLTAAGTTFSLSQVWLHFGHRMGAVAVTIVLIPLIVLVVRRAPSRTARFGAVSLAVLLLLQVKLGVLVILLKKPAELATAHVATGALVLAMCAVVLVELHGTPQTRQARPTPPAGDTDKQGFDTLLRMPA